MRATPLRTLREQRGLTQEQLSTLSDVSQNQISKLESGQARNPSYATVAALARALRVDVAAILFGPAPRLRRKRAVA